MINNTPQGLSDEERKELVKAMQEMYQGTSETPSVNLTPVMNNATITNYDSLSSAADPYTWASPLYPPYPESKEQRENKKLLMDIDCIKDSETGEYHLIVKAGLRIDKADIVLSQKGSLSESLIKRIQKLRDSLDQLLKNKQSLIALLR